ncbi:MAG: hypothetical protein HZC54_10640 [Verrucomicrobia bacterium]|nr:hypothetical protein [Verrucomicrobiota bacterium]
MNNTSPGRNSPVLISRMGVLHLVLLLAFSLCNNCRPIGATFTGLGAAPGDKFSQAWAVSDDGRVVVGSSYVALRCQAFRWTVAEGMVGLGVLPGCSNSLAKAVSSDGSTVVGISYSDPPHHAFRWTAASGMVDLGVLPGSSDSEAVAVSSNGLVVAGDCFRKLAGFRWTAATGMVGLGFLTNYFGSQAQGISSDGSVIVGRCHSDSGAEAYRWTKAGGMLGLGPCSGGTLGTPVFVSDDGSVVVSTGISSSTNALPYRWTAAKGMEWLGTAPEYTMNVATAMSSDGTVVVGYTESDAFSQAFRCAAGTGLVSLGSIDPATGRTDNTYGIRNRRIPPRVIDRGPDGELRGNKILGPKVDTVAQSVSADGSIIVGRIGSEEVGKFFVWDRTNQMRELEYVLTHDYKVDLAGWKLEGERVRVSADAKTIVGDGMHNGHVEAWVVHLDKSVNAPVAKGPGK